MRGIEDIIAAEVAGRSFVDVGGLWGTVNERCTLAARSGATKTTMLDMQTRDNALWQAFRAHCAAAGVTGVSEIVGNIEDADFVARLQSFDVVHCSGVIYHAPNPFQMLLNLRRFTARTLILVSMTVPEWIVNRRGLLRIDPAQPVCVPLIDSYRRRVLGRHFDGLGFAVHNVNSAEPHPWIYPPAEPNFGPWWWIWPPETLRRMLETCGFTVREITPLGRGHVHALVADIRPI